MGRKKGEEKEGFKFRGTRARKLGKGIKVGGRDLD